MASANDFILVGGINYMVNIQSEFISFHNKIKLSDENSELREKRNILLDKLKKNISQDAASYTTFNQGSYAMGTGIKPDDGDFDIDVGLKFDIDHDDYPDPVQVKKWVKNALDGHTKSVKIRRSCVTVTYQKDNDPIYHVDFAVYAANNSDGQMYIAKGKENSQAEYRCWEPSDPQGLLDHVQSLFDDSEDRAQFRRLVRYMKKWKNQHFSNDGNGAPTGIALTALACSYFSPQSSTDFWTKKKTYDDFTALKEFINKVKNAFVYIWDAEDETFYWSITQELPVEPKNNLFEKMTNKQKNNFYNEICKLYAKLIEAEGKDKKSEVCQIMVDIFGTDFPVVVERSYVGTSESA